MQPAGLHDSRVLLPSYCCSPLTPSTLTLLLPRRASKNIHPCACLASSKQMAIWSNARPAQTPLKLHTGALAQPTGQPAQPASILSGSRDSGPAGCSLALLCRLLSRSRFLLSGAALFPGALVTLALLLSRRLLRPVVVQVIIQLLRQPKEGLRDFGRLIWTDYFSFFFRTPKGAGARNSTAFSNLRFAAPLCLSSVPPG